MTACALFQTSALPTLAKAQQGLFTHAQAASVGVLDRQLRGLVANGTIARLASGLYVWGLDAPSSPEGRLWRAHLLAGIDSALGGRAALWLAACHAPLDEKVGTVVWVPRSGRRRGGRGVDVRRDGEGRLAHKRGTLPRIRVEDALLDVAQAEGYEEFVAVATEACRRHRTTPEQLVRVLDARVRFAQRRLVRATLQELRGVESSLELAYQRDVEEAHGLPNSELQQSVSQGTRTDAWYRAFQVLVEIDGLQGHLDQPFRDLRRDNRHALLAFTTLRYGSGDLRGDPCAVARQVAAALQLRGWAGEPTRCSRCPEAPAA